MLGKNRLHALNSTVVSLSAVQLGFVQSNGVRKPGRMAAAVKLSSIKPVLFHVAENLLFRFCIMRCVFIQRNHAFYFYVSIPPSTCSTCPVM